MPACCAFGCTNRKTKDDCRNKTFFRFPSKNPKLVKDWLVRIRRHGFNPSQHTVICSDHFEEDCFVYQPFTNRRSLKQNSVPTKFIFSKPVKPRRKIVRHCLPSTSSQGDTDANDEDRLKSTVATLNMAAMSPVFDPTKASLYNYRSAKKSLGASMSNGQSSSTIQSVPVQLSSNSSTVAPESYMAVQEGSTDFITPDLPEELPKPCSSSFAKEDPDPSTAIKIKEEPKVVACERFPMTPDRFPNVLESHSSVTNSQLIAANYINPHLSVTEIKQEPEDLSSVSQHNVTFPKPYERFPVINTNPEPLTINIKQEPEDPSDIALTNIIEVNHCGQVSRASCRTDDFLSAMSHKTLAKPYERFSAMDTNPESLIINIKQDRQIDKFSEKPSSSTNITDMFQTPALICDEIVTEEEL